MKKETLPLFTTDPESCLSCPSTSQSSPAVTLGGGEWVVFCPPPGTEANLPVMVTSTTALPVGSESLAKLLIIQAFVFNFCVRSELSIITLP